MAKSLWPKGILVSIIIFDGVVYTPDARARMPERDPDGFAIPDALVETAWMLATQDRHAWSSEVEARPASELW